MKPKQVNKYNEGLIYLNLYENLKNVKNKIKFNINDRVRISNYKRKIFDKGYTPNWTEKIFIIDKIEPTTPITYKLKDLNNEEIKGSFYKQELQKTNQEQCSP